MIPKFCRCDEGIEKYDQFVNQEKSRSELREYKRQKSNYMLKKSGVGKRFREKRLSDFDSKSTTFKLLNNYVEKREDEKDNGKYGLYIWGFLGSGKTHTAAAIVNELVERYSTLVMFVSMSDIANRIKKTFGSDKSDKDNADSTLFDDLINCELLVIDDLGLENLTVWLRENLFLIINKRYEENRPVIITSSQSLEDYSALFPQVSSRLSEMCITLRFQGEDKRPGKRPDVNSLL